MLIIIKKKLYVKWILSIIHPCTLRDFFINQNQQLYIQANNNFRTGLASLVYLDSKKDN